MRPYFVERLEEFSIDRVTETWINACLFLLSYSTFLNFTDCLNITPNALHFTGFCIYNRKTFKVEKYMKVSFLYIAGFCSMFQIGPSTHTRTHAHRQDIEQRYGARSYTDKLFTLLSSLCSTHDLSRTNTQHNTATQHNTTQHVTWQLLLKKLRLLFIRHTQGHTLSALSTQGLVFKSLNLIYVMYKNSVSTSQKTHGLHYTDQPVSAVARTEKRIKLKKYGLWEK